jgi:hypothetical protein
MKSFACLKNFMADIHSLGIISTRKSQTAARTRRNEDPQVTRASCPCFQSHYFATKK